MVSYKTVFLMFPLWLFLKEAHSARRLHQINSLSLRLLLNTYAPHFTPQILCGDQQDNRRTNCLQVTEPSLPLARSSIEV